MTCFCKVRVKHFYLRDFFTSFIGFDEKKCHIIIDCASSVLITGWKTLNQAGKR